MGDKAYDNTWNTEKEALLTVTNCKLAMEDISKISKLLSENSHNQKFIRDIADRMPQFMEHIRTMTNRCVQGMINA